MSTFDSIKKKCKEAKQTGDLNLSGIQLQQNDVLILLEGEVREIHENIKQVTLMNCGLNKFPSFLHQCYLIEALWINQNQIPTVEDDLKYFPLLEVLDLSANPVTLIPKNIITCKQLKNLYLNDTQILNIPEVFLQLDQLETLEIKKHNLENAVSSIKNFPASLKSLEISGGILGPEIPSFGHLINLESLILNNNGLNEIEDDLYNLSKLSHLVLSNNNLNSLPDSITALVNLEYLDINSNSIERLPERIGMPGLIHANFSTNNLRDMPQNVQSWYGMTSLLINFNSLKYLNDYSTQMPDLSLIEAGYNQFEIIPDWLQKCELLNHISFAFNPLIILPSWLIEKDRYIDLRGTQVTAEVINNLFQAHVNVDVEILISETPAAKNKNKLISHGQNVKYVF